MGGPTSHHVVRCERYMPSKRPQLTNGEFYHVYNRGVDRRNVFMDDRDRYRFIHDLYEFNDERSVVNLYRLSESERLLHRLPGRIRKPRKQLVRLIAFVEMPNHYHLLLQQKVDGGISLFMQKLGTGYTMYFNERYERSGALFQGKFKVKHVDQENYLRHLVSYIHANPAPLLKHGSALKRYRWSSYPDYIGKEKNFPSLISWDLAEELALPRGAEQLKHTQDVIQGKFSSDIQRLTFEE